MRTLSILLVLLMSGCGYFGSIMATGTGPGHDPSKIYLGRSAVLVTADQADNYGCLGQPMLCASFGSKMECRCPY